MSRRSWIIYRSASKNQPNTKIGHSTLWSDTSNESEAPVTTSTTPLYKQVSFSTSRAPIPLAVTGGFQATPGGSLNSKADNHQLNIQGGTSSTHHTLIIGDNGAGKSTILDALTFVLFGKPFRSVNKNQLVNSINQARCQTWFYFS